MSGPGIAMRLPRMSARVIGVARDEARAVAIAHRGAVRQQRVAVGQVGVGVDRDRGDLELTAHRALVQRLDVLQLVDVGEAFGVDLPGGERVEHERVVGIRAVGDVDRGHRVMADVGCVERDRRCRSRGAVYSGSCFARSAGAAATNLSWIARARRGVLSQARGVARRG